MTGTFVIDLAARYAAVFGAMALSESMYRKAVVTKEENEYNVDFYPEYNADFEDITMEWENEILEFNSVFMFEGDKYFAAPPIITFSREKNLITTEISGSDGVVVERWGINPWEMNITVLLIDLVNHQYPTERIRNISSLFEFNGPVRVEGVQFEEKNIDSIYFESIDISPVKGFSDTIQVVLTAKSIREVFYNLLKPND